MSNTIYSIQEKLDSILDIEHTHTIPDAELFDTSDYPNDGKAVLPGWTWFDRTGLPGPWRGKKMSDEHRKNMSIAHTGHKDSEETKRKKSESAKLGWEKRKLKRRSHGNNNYR